MILHLSKELESIIDNRIRKILAIVKLITEKVLIFLLITWD